MIKEEQNLSKLDTDAKLQVQNGKLATGRVARLPSRT
jgi:hypothetical protein